VAAPTSTMRSDLRQMPRPVWFLFAGSFVNRFGSFVLPFLVLYLTRRGYTPAQAGFAISAYGIGSLGAAAVGGQLADRLSARGVFAAGAGVYVLGYAVFAWQQHRWPVLAIGFLLCGVGIGFAETAESTVVAQLLPDHLRSNGFGVLGLVQSFGDLGATLVAGILWSLFSPTVAFGYAAAWMALSVAASGWLRPRGQRPVSSIP